LLQHTHMSSHEPLIQQLQASTPVASERAS
jgi:hypothetical protein